MMLYVACTRAKLHLDLGGAEALFEAPEDSGNATDEGQLVHATPGLEPERLERP